MKTLRFFQLVFDFEIEIYEGYDVDEMSESEVTCMMKNPNIYKNIKDEIIEGAKKISIMKINQKVSSADFESKMSTSTKATRRRPQTAAHNRRPTQVHKRITSAKPSKNA